VYVLFPLSDLLTKLIVVADQRVKSSADIFPYHITHTLHFVADLGNRHSAVSDRVGRLERPDVLQAEFLVVLLLAVRKDLCRDIRHLSSERKQEQRRHDIEDRSEEHTSELQSRFDLV